MRLYQSHLGRPSLPALAVGASLLVAGSLMRAAGQPFLGVAPMAAASLTCLVFVVPAFVAGAIAPRAAILDGAVLGMIGAAFVTLQIAQFHQPDWSSLLVYKTIGLLACLGVPLCTLGAVLGGRLFRSR
jgi:hypothetical protein